MVNNNTNKKHIAMHIAAVIVAASFIAFIILSIPFEPENTTPEVGGIADELPQAWLDKLTIIRDKVLTYYSRTGECPDKQIADLNRRIDDYDLPAEVTVNCYEQWDGQEGFEIQVMYNGRLYSKGYGPQATERTFVKDPPFSAAEERQMNGQ